MISSCSPSLSLSVYIYIYTRHYTLYSKPIQGRFDNTMGAEPCQRKFGKEALQGGVVELTIGA